MDKVATLFGYHGHSNFGDDYFLSFALKALKDSGHGTVYLIARPHARQAYDIPDALTVIFAMGEKRKFRGYDKFTAILSCARRSDTLLFCAGSIFKIMPFRLLKTVLKLSRLGRSKLKVVALGVSLGPLKRGSDKKHLADSVAQFDHLILRDKASEAYTDTRTSFDIGRDIAFTQVADKNAVKRKKSIVLCVHPYKSLFDATDERAERDRNQLIADQLAFVHGDTIKDVGIFVTCSDDDSGDMPLSQDLARRLAAHGIAAEIYEHNNVIASEAYLSQFEKALCSRLHTGFFSLLNGAHVYQLAYAAKIENFYYDVALPAMTFDDAYALDTARVAEFLKAPYKKCTAQAEALAAVQTQTTLQYQQAVARYLGVT